MRAHTIDGDDIKAIADMVAKHRVVIAMGRDRGGNRKAIVATMHQQFFVEADGGDKWHGTDWREAVEFYNTL